MTVTLGVGIDAVEVPRFRKVAERTPSILDRLFTISERDYCEQVRDPHQRFAARFAAKEAVLKAMGVGLGACAWHDIEVLRSDSGQPLVRLTGKAQSLADELGVADWQLSLTHTESIAAAMVVASGER